MAKELGQIHVVDYSLSNAASGDLGLIDLPGKLSQQLQHRCRMMSIYKVVGIDIAIVGSGTAAVSGKLSYYAPTKGRVEALKKAWIAMKDMFKLKGIDYWNNLNYDFRPPFSFPGAFLLNGAQGSDFLNQASLESVGGVPGALCLTGGAAGYNSIFDTYNDGIQPSQTAAVDFSSGFNVIEAGTAGDMVINEGEYIESWVPNAETDPESIPFQLSMDTLGDTSSGTFQWRPDPALYLAVLTGQIVIDIALSSESLVDLRLSVMVVGWKSIMGEHRPRRRRSKKGGKKHGRRRRSKK